MTGRVPFDGENFNDLMFKIALAPRPNPLHFRPSLDPGMAAIILRSIAADPGERFSSAGEFRATLVSWLESRGAGPMLTPELRPIAKSSSAVSLAEGSAQSPARGNETRLASALPTRAPGSPDRSSQTPLSSASPSVRRASRRRAVVVGAGVAVILGVLGVTAGVRLRATPESAGAAFPPSQTGAPAPESSVAPESATRRAVTAVAEVPAPERLPEPVETAAVAPPSAVTPPAAAPPSPAGALAAPFSGGTGGRPVGPAFPVAASAPGPAPAVGVASPGASPAGHAIVRPALSAPASSRAVTADGAGFTTSLDSVKPPPGTPTAAAPVAPPAAPSKDAARPFEKIEGREVRTGL
ncbi:MAG: hypothetical protein JOZ69_25690 [Myxococcales bacterium]|nr:hypothetical protein [Myxococcales bacterium]